MKNSKKFLSSKISLFDKTGVEDWRQFIDSAGKVNPFYVLFDESEFVTLNNEWLSGHYYFRSKPRLQHAIFGLYNTTFRLEESI